MVYNLSMNFHEETKCWWLTEDTDGQVGYVTVAHLITILDMVLYTRKSMNTMVKDKQESSTYGTNIGG